MKFLTVIALLSLSLSSFAGANRLIRGAGSAESTVDASIPAAVQQAELTKIAEGRAFQALSRSCSGSFELTSGDIAQRNVKQSVGAYGRTMVVNALAVGNCEFVRQF